MAASNDKRSHALKRQWSILLKLNSRGTVETELMEEHGCTRRTIQRDFAVLEAAGFPLYDEDVEGRKVWRLATPLRKLL